MNEAKRTFLELLVIAVAGTATGLTANAVHRNRLPLATNHFKIVSPNRTGGQDRDTTRNTDTQTARNSANGADPDESSLEDNPEESAIIDYLENQHGYQALAHDEVVEVYQDPFHDDEVYIFVDARGDELHTEGHIPGAYPYNHYNKDPYIEAVREACRAAEKVVIYCEGGKCPDSIGAIGDLFEEGIGWDRLFIYAGGMTMWAEKGMPIEKGERLSGDITEGHPQ